jgi:hydroxyacylglutathione hydrolase
MFDIILNYDIMSWVIQMEIVRFSLGELRSNCYVISERGEALIIDPGYESDEVMKYIQKNMLSVEGIYLTHGHPDHVGGVQQIKSVYQSKVFAPSKDKLWMGKSSYNQIGYEIPVDVYVHHGDSISMIGRTWKVYETPGHSQGSTVLFTPGVLFTGDTLFYESIGRTDIPLSDFNHIKKSIQNIFEWFEEDTICYPGHGRSTTILHEKKHNPFIKK